MFSYRPVQEIDIPLICQFPQSEEELFFLYPKASYPLTFDQLKKAIDQRTDSTVVLWNRSVVGFANFYICDPGSKCAIGNVVVAPTARARGVGRYLVETMVQLAFAKHMAKEVQISCFNQNVASLLLYSRLGFLPVSVEERIDKQGNRVALIQMKLSGGNH
jgi:ribosomal protein S18 acetylase RimI-like enzyme